MNEYPVLSGDSLGDFIPGQGTAEEKEATMYENEREEGAVEMPEDYEPDTI